ncbi:nucleobase:cation symporter-1, NCS1 family, partial [Phenoliferia sp. Uapishka_3]
MGFSNFIKMIEAPSPEGLTGAERFLQNDDLLPVPESQRLWKTRNYLAFWLADSFNVNTFQIASSMVALGMTWWQAWLAVWVGYGTAACFLVLNAYPGAKYHIIFPAYARASFGPIGALWPVMNRAVMACIWYGVQAWIGGQCIYTLLCAIWPQTAKLGLHIIGNPANGLDAGRLIGFILFSALSLIPIYFPLHKIRHLFTLKAIVAPIGGIALFAWCLSKAGGAGPIIHAPATITGSALGWGFVINLMSCISNMATLITNATDFASRASRPRDVIIPQLIALPCTFAIVSLFGIFIGSSSTLIFGSYIWSPLAIMDAFLEKFPSHSTRAGVAIIAMCFTVAQLGTNIAANSISAGCDLTSLFPRFLSIRRGGYVCALIGFCMCPWILESSSSKFESYLSGYSVFLSSIAGVLISHFWVVAKQNIKIDDLYTLDGVYAYTYGVNPRAYAAYFAGIAINVVGFAGDVGTPVNIVATRIFELSFFTGFLASSAVYIGLNYIFPVRQPTTEECAIITVGRKEWFGETGSVEREDSEDKKSYDEKTGVVSV